MSTSILRHDAREGERPAVTPLAALLLAVAGGALIGRRRSLATPARAAATVSGLALIGAAAQRPVADALRRAGTRRRAGALELSVVVRHPVDVVFGFCSNFENYPRIVGVLREVRDYGDGRSRWCASTPSGGTIEWDCVTTKYVPNSVIAWESVAGAPVRMRATLRFVPEERRTRLTVTARYEPMDGTLADALVALTTPTRVAELEAEIRRLGTYLDSVRPAPALPPARR